LLHSQERGRKKGRSVAGPLSRRRSEWKRGISTPHPQVKKGTASRARREGGKKSSSTSRGQGGPHDHTRKGKSMTCSWEKKKKISPASKGQKKKLSLTTWKEREGERGTHPSSARNRGEKQKKKCMREDIT